MNTQIDFNALVDKAYEAAGGETDTKPMTWVRMEAALSAVRSELARTVPKLDLDAARTAADRMRRVIDVCTDQHAKEQLTVLLKDLNDSLGG